VAAVRLSQRDFDALQRAILELHDHYDVPAFRKAVPEILLGIIPAAYIATLNLTRALNETDFTQRDRLIFNLLRPHVDQARRNAEMISARRAAEAQPLVTYGLSPRESEVAQWLGWGKTNPQIANILGMQPRTVEKHLERILEKLGVENRTTAALMITDGESTSPHSSSNGNGDATLAR
jgi:DNA-binding NarL/FixJ family response regulator